MSNQVYYCHLCSHPYADTAFTTPKGIRYDQISINKNCTQTDSCPGYGFGGLCVPAPNKTQAIILKEESDKHDEDDDDNIGLEEYGLCVFLMDASGSMGDAAYGAEQPSTLSAASHPNDSAAEKAGYMSKREVMATNAALGIFSLSKIRDNHKAFISIILYDDTTKYLFFHSVEKIVKDYKHPLVFAKYLLEQMKSMNNGTNINAALELAYSLVKQFGAVAKKDRIKALGDYAPYKQDVLQKCDVFTGKKMRSSIQHPGTPNIRVLLYTDGEHQTNYGILKSPFQTDIPNFLIGVYIGKAGQDGDRELRQIIKYCPVHGNQQYLVVEKPEDSTNLYGIFVMSTGASGFCLQCVTDKLPGGDKRGEDRR